MIADKYRIMKLPYRYECPLQLEQDGHIVTVRPDFTVLLVKLRKVIYHEHFGMMDHPEYVDQFLRKMQLYAENGIFPGDRLLLTFESRRRPLDLTLLEKMIGQIILGSGYIS